jgi:hypothetical protein
MSEQPKPTPSQERVLRLLLAGQQATRARGIAKTLEAMVCRGWLTHDHKLTGLGREVAEKLQHGQEA